jgi:hypothetical protein
LKVYCSIFFIVNFIKFSMVGVESGWLHVSHGVCYHKYIVEVQTIEEHRIGILV